MEIIIHLFVIFIIVLMTSMTASSMEHTLVSDVAVLAVGNQECRLIPCLPSASGLPVGSVAVVCVAVVWRTKTAFLVDACTQRCAPVDIAMSLSLVQQVGD